LRFNIVTSSLPELYKEQLLQLNAQRITKEGVVVIKAQQYHSQEKNREEALRRLQELIKSVSVLPRKRKPTKPTRTLRKNASMDKLSPLEERLRIEVWLRLTVFNNNK